MKNLSSRFFANQSGAMAVEYGLIAALIVLAMAGAVISVRTKLEAVFLQAASAVPVDLPAADSDE
jgi:pilus assembly protein Flp/PilA